jgi:hypothetical protein
MPPVKHVAIVDKADALRALHKQVGAKRVLVPVGEKTVIVELSTASTITVEPDEDIVL